MYIFFSFFAASKHRATAKAGCDIRSFLMEGGSSTRTSIRTKDKICCHRDHFYVDIDIRPTRPLLLQRWRCCRRVGISGTGHFLPSKIRREQKLRIQPSQKVLENRAIIYSTSPLSEDWYKVDFNMRYPYIWLCIPYNDKYCPSPHDQCQASIDITPKQTSSIKERTDTTSLSLPKGLANEGEVVVSYSSFGWHKIISLKTIWEK